MKISVNRFDSDHNGTVGLLRIDGPFECFCLEDQYQAVKVPGDTRIPAGIYPIHLRNAGNLTKRYAELFPDIHKGMLWLQGVPGFKWIYIHVGNTSLHTEGCLLVGGGAQAVPGKKRVRNSTAAYRALYTKVVAAAAAGELEIEIIDNDRG